MAYETPHVLPSGASLEQFKQGGASGLLERLISANSEGYTVLDYQLIRAVKDRGAEDVYRQLRQLVFAHNSRAFNSMAVTSPLRVDPVDTLQQLKHIHNAFAVLTQLCAEIAAFIESEIPPEPQADPLSESSPCLQPSAAS